MYKIFRITLVASIFAARWVWRYFFIPMLMANILSSTLANSFCKCRNTKNKPDDTGTYTCCVDDTLSAKYNLVWSVTHRRVCRISVIIIKSLHQKLIKLSLSVIALTIRCTMIKAYGPHAAILWDQVICTTVIWVEWGKPAWIGHSASKQVMW